MKEIYGTDISRDSPVWKTKWKKYMVLILAETALSEKQNERKLFKFTLFQEGNCNS
jgi:hypothetical protein